MNGNDEGLLTAAVLEHFRINRTNISQSYKSFRQPPNRRWEQTEVTVSLESTIMFVISICN
jgi:hypothetical protein